MNKASCLSLKLSNAVVLWNTLQARAGIVTELRAGGTTISRTKISVHVWPPQRRHITLERGLLRQPHHAGLRPTGPGRSLNGTRTRHHLSKAVNLACNTLPYKIAALREAHLKHRASRATRPEHIFGTTISLLLRPKSASLVEKLNTLQTDARHRRKDPSPPPGGARRRSRTCGPA